ncbi:U6 snRNA-associated Sm-like protein LSm7 [Pholiota conissans]|uniref:U6 snRNA-associated Sm-like protein LSm7 n=1 Tax=Pholiota conissans TaxID=109636 RepID=A0A9P5Z5B6_9AGAR|nr:U6 snRNA-associated Sm-like protein LSm7 [Pholiota conissans]
MADRARGAPFRGRGAAPHQKRPVTGPSFAQSADKPRREAILDLSKYVDERIRVKFTGGREVTGILKGYDQLLNIVLDEVTEELQLPEPHIRTLGLTVLRGPTITVLNPVDGSEEIANPFLAAEQ